MSTNCPAAGNLRKQAAYQCYDSRWNKELILIHCFAVNLLSDKSDSLLGSQDTNMHHCTGSSASTTELLISTGVHSPCSMGNMSEPNPLSALHGRWYRCILMPRRLFTLPSSDIGMLLCETSIKAIHPPYK